MQRYRVEDVGDPCYMEEWPDGMWVMYDDVEAELAALQRDAARWRWLRAQMPGWPDSEAWAFGASGADLDTLADQGISGAR